MLGHIQVSFLCLYYLCWGDTPPLQKKTNIYKKKQFFHIAHNALTKNHLLAPIKTENPVCYTLVMQ